MNQKPVLTVIKPSSVDEPALKTLSCYTPDDCDLRVKSPAKGDHLNQTRQRGRLSADAQLVDLQTVYAELVNLAYQVAIMGEQLGRLLEFQSGPRLARQAYTVEEAAKLLNRSSYTVREHCRYGRIIATKREERRGGAAVWSISAEEVQRIKDNGLLTTNSMRNAS